MISGHDSPPPSRHRHHKHKNHLSAAYAVVSRPAAFFGLLTLSFLLGYVARTHPMLYQPADDLRLHHTFPTKCSDPIQPARFRQTVLDRVYGGVSPWKGFPPAHAKPHLRQEWAKGWGSNASVFEHLFRQVRPKTVIEIGTFLGASALHMVGLARRMGLDDVQIFCVDDFRGWPGYYDETEDGGRKSVDVVNGDSYLLYQFMQNAAAANATDSLMFLPFAATTALEGLCDWGIYGDLVEVDAAHDFHSAWVDINNAYKVLRPGGVLFGHDYVWEGVRTAVHIFARNNGFQVREDGEHWILYRPDPTPK